MPRILIEPGRAVVANAGITLYTVGTIKDVPGIRTYVAVDGGMTDNIRPALYGARYECLVANKADQPRTEVVTVAGKHCETGDLIARDVPIQPVETGDILARVRDRRLLPVDVEQLQQAGAPRRSCSSATARCASSCGARRTTT